ncbi:hypothetical protein NBRC116602_24890 [Hyphomicrobiales bacterium 4NK60-0047b]
MLKLKSVNPYDRYEKDIAKSRVKSFLADNPNPAIRQRLELEVDKAFDKGLALYVEDGGEVCGCSLIYDLSNEGDYRFSYQELGTMRIVKNGLGLQEMLAQIHLFQFLLDGGHPDQVTIFAVVSPHSPSEHVLRDNLVMKSWNPVQDLMDLRARSGCPFNPDKQVLRADVNCWSNSQHFLKKLHKHDYIFSCPKGDTDIEFDISWFHPCQLDADILIQES